jgi:hypothetical protein
VRNLYRYPGIACTLLPSCPFVLKGTVPQECLQWKFVLFFKKKARSRISLQLLLLIQVSDHHSQLKVDDKFIIGVNENDKVCLADFIENGEELLAHFSAFQPENIVFFTVISKLRKNLWKSNV